MALAAADLHVPVIGVRSVRRLLAAIVVSAAMIPVASALTNQTITFAAIANKTYGVAPFTVSPTASSGLPVALTSTTPLICSVSSATITVLAAGACTIQATQAGNATYAAAPPISRSFTVAKANQTITFASIPGQSYGVVPFRISATASSGLAVALTSTTVSVCTVGGTTVTILAAGSCTIQATQPGDANYNAAPSVGRTFTVAKAGQLITFAAPSATTYGAPPFDVSATASSGLPVSFASTTATVCTVAGTTVTIVTAGTCTLQATQAGDANFKAAPNVNRNVTVAKAAQTITFAALGATTFGAPPFDVSASASSGLPVTFASTTATVCTASGTTVTILAGGTCTIRASQAGDGNHAAAPNVSQSFTVAKASQTITFGALAGQTLGAAPFDVSATASSGLPVTFASTTTTVCTVSGATVTIVAAGTCTIRASQAGNSGYSAAANVSQSFAVTKASQTITFAALASQTLGAAPFAVSATASSGLAVTFTSLTTPVCTVASGTVTLRTVGTCTIQAAQAGNANYAAATPVPQSFAVTSALQNQTITFGALANQTFGAAPFAISATASSGLPVNFTSLTTPVCTVAGNTVTIVSAGTCTIQAAQAGNATYAAAPSVSQSFTVGQATQTITFGALASQTLGAAPFAISATASSGLPVGFASNTLPVCTVSASSVTIVSAGTCTIQASQAGNASYLAAPTVSQSFNVAKAAQTINFGALSNQALGAAPFTVSASASSGLAVTFASTTTPVCTVSGATVTLVATGTCTIQATQAGNANYNAAAPVSQSFTVAGTSQTITFATLIDKTFGDAPFGVSASASSGLPVTFASTTTPVCTLSGSAVTLVSAGTCTIQATQAGNATYAAASPVNQSFNVAKAAQSITFTALSDKLLGSASFTVGATASSGLTVMFTSTTAAVCTVSGVTVTLVAAGTCTLQASQAGNANYAAASNVNQSFAVANALQGQTITFGALANQVFGVSPFAISATASSGLPVEFASQTSSVCTVSGSTVTIMAAGSCTIQASQAGNSAYSAAPTVTQAFMVAQASQVITFGALANQLLGAAPFVVSATASSGLAVNFASTTAAVCTVSGATVTLGTAGTCTIRASQPGNANYAAAANVDQSFSVTQVAQSLSFAAAVNYAAGNYPEGLVLVDLNGDGKADLVVVNSNSFTASVFIGNGDGTFVPGTALATGTLPTHIAVGDLNGDGKADLVISNILGNSVTVYLGNGNGTFGGPSTVPVGLAPFGVAIADLNGDGKADLVVVNGSSGSTVGQTVSVLLGNGNGTFQARSAYSTGSGPIEVAVRDLNGDGKLDLVVSSTTTNSVSVLLGNGDGTFRPQVTYATGAYPEALALVDLNGDGKLDLAVTNANGNSVSILLGRGDGTFGPANNFSVGFAPQGLATADFDGDGKVDLVVGNAFDNVVSVLQGNGDGTFRAAKTFATGLYPAAMAVGDLNGDGRVDLVVSDYLSKSVSVLLNGTTLNSAATVTIQSGTPQSALLNAPYATALSVVVRDSVNNVIPGALVNFTAPAFGASGTFPGSLQSVQVATDGSGVATAPTLSANGTAGLFLLLARYSAATATFALTNSTSVLSPVFTSAPPPSGTVNVPYSFAVTASGTPTPTFSTLPSSLPTGLTLNGTSGLIAGTPGVPGTFAGSITATNGLPPDATQTFAITIANLAQSITFAPLVNRIFGSAPFTVSATASSGLAVTFSSLTTSICTVSGSSVTLVNTGTCTIRASQAGNTSYAPAPNVDQSFSVIAGLSQTITFGALSNLTIGAPAFALTAMASSGMAVSFSTLTASVCTVSGSVATIVAVGGCSIRASQAGNGTYSPAPNVDQSFSVTAVGVTALFAPPVVYPAGGYPAEIAVADLNGDGNLDLVVVEFSDIAIYLGNGDGTFAPRTSFIPQFLPSHVAVADYDGDGIPDLAITTTAGSVVMIYPGKGDGTFKAVVLATISAAQNGIVAGDLDGDDKTDFVVLTDPTSNVGPFIGAVLSNGNGTFQPVKYSFTGGGSQAIAIGDFNNDGKPDVVVAHNSTNGMTIMLGKGDGTFAPVSPDTFVPSPIGINVADLNDDGKLDLVVNNGFSVGVLLGHGDGTFAPAVNYSTGNSGSGAAVGDFNGDGIPDIAVTNLADNNVAVLLGNGDGTFKPALLLAAGSLPSGVGRGDLNGDGKLDLALVSTANGTVTVLLDIAAADAPATISVNAGSPQSAVIFTNYATPLSVVVRDAGSHPLPGLPVSLTAPTSGAGGTFRGGKSTIQVVTDAFGVATGPTFTANATAGPFSVVAHLAALNATFALTNTGASQAPLFTSGTLPPGAYSAPYTFTLTASGSPSPTFSVTANALPAGLALNGVTGVISGTPTVAGNFTGTLTATNGVAPAAAQTFSLAIALATQTISFAPLAGQVFGAPPFLVNATATSGLAVSFSSLTPSVCATTGNTVAIISAGACTISASQTGSAVYSAAQSVNQSFTISAASQTIVTFNQILPQSLTSLPMGPPRQLVAVASSGLVVSFTTLTPSVCVTDGDWLVTLSTGICTVRAAQAGDGNYFAAPNVDQTFPVGNAAQTLYLWRPADRLKSMQPVQLSAYASSGLPITFASLTPTFCFVNGSIATFAGPTSIGDFGGTCTIQASVPAGPDFAAATATQSFHAYAQGEIWTPVVFSGPHLEYSAALGSSIGDTAFDVLVGTDGSAYVGGSVAKTDFPGLDSTTFTNGGLDLTFLAKLGATDASVIFASAVGGRAANMTDSGAYAYVGSGQTITPAVQGGGQVEAMTKDAAGNLYVAAYLNSSQFPAGGGTYIRTGSRYIFRVTQGGALQQFSAAIDPAVSTIRAIAVDDNGSVYFTGVAAPGLVTTGGAIVPTISAPAQPLGPYLIKLAPGGATTAFATYLSVRGSRPGARTVNSPSRPPLDTETTAYAIALDGAGNSYLAGQANTDDFPVTPGAAGGPAWNQDNKYRDAFVAKVNPTGTAFVFVARLNGAGPATTSDAERATSIALSPDGGIVIGGKSATFPFYGVGSAFQTQVQFAPQTTSGAREIGFVAKLLPDGSDWIFVAPIGALGGNLIGGESIFDPSPCCDPVPVKVAVDTSGNIYAVGTTAADRFLPVTSGIPGVGATGAFIMKLTGDGSRQLYSTTLGGGIGAGVALDGFGNAFVSGYGGGTPLISGKIVPGLGTNISSAFVAKVNDQLAPLILTTDQNPGNAGRPVNLSARVGDLRYTGSVEFRSGTQSVGTVSVAAGTAAMTLALPAGVYRLSAVFHGAGPIDGVTAPEVVQIVDQTPASP